VRSRAGSIGPRRVLNWGLATARRQMLDELIAGGVDPGSSPACQERARQLMKKSRRAALAAEIDAIVNVVGESRSGDPPSPLWLASLRVEEVRAARTQLSAVALLLRSIEQPAARGVALAMLLVRDGRSPLFVRYGPADVKQAADATTSALLGSPESTEKPGTIAVVSREDWSAACRPARDSPWPRLLTDLSPSPPAP
jgi:hypothetical protein